ncbi:MAG: class I SAM-dependent methyltransferase [Verrucomicrobia bacterium]|nr:class I SAM-dependent methyltransferase [Verrucomicrobiota bacterium]
MNPHQPDIPLDPNPAVAGPPPVAARVRNNYRRAVAAGGYDLYSPTRAGKHDAVRIFWEDQIRRRFLRPHLLPWAGRTGRPLRVLDLGCGSGQGFSLLSQIEREPRSLLLHEEWVIGPGEIEYTGVDLSEAMVAKGRENFAGYDNVFFFQADLNEGLGALNRESPFEIYFSSYGSFSHLSRVKLTRLLAEISRHAQPGALVVLDLNGRYSIEWPEYWTARTEAEKVRDYTMNYLYLGDPEAMAEADHFPLRFWTGAEVRQLAVRASQLSGVGLTLVDQMDVSVLVGRHVDTAQYHPALPPLRSRVNSLHQDFVRTDLDQLLVPPELAGQHPLVSPGLAQLIRSWNTLVGFTRRRLERPVRFTDLADWTHYPPGLQFAIMGMDRLIADASWIQNGDARANLVEPQLAYLLRSLEIGLQQGIGCGHGHLALFRVGSGS